MIERCSRSKRDNFEHYGGRGITVCERWQTFENFFADMGERPAGTSLDRLDVNGHYEPGNCRWATKKEQMRNMRTNRIVEYQGRTMTLADAAEQAGLDYCLVMNRLSRYGWTVDRALGKPA